MVEWHTLSRRLGLRVILAAGFLFVPAIGLAAPPPGDSPEDQGRFVFSTQDDMDLGFQDAKVIMSMFLMNAAGQKSRRKMVTQFLEVSDDGRKTLITFQYPRDIKGTGLLTYEHLDTKDDQWLYLPALKRVKRIVSGNKSGSFVGSEFSYEDISSTEHEKYTYKYMREDIHHGPVWVVERYPKDQSSGYSKIVSWVDQSNYQIVKQTYFDRKGAPLKTEIVEGLTRHLGQFWRPTKVNMENLQTKKKTILVFEDWEFRQGLKSSLFTRRSLERQR